MVAERNAAMRSRIMSQICGQCLESNFDKRKIMNTDLNELEKISTDAWIAILKQHPDYAKECSQINAWSRFTHKQWLELLLAQPQFEGKCECFNDFSFSLLQILSDKHPGIQKNTCSKPAL